MFGFGRSILSSGAAGAGRYVGVLVREVLGMRRGVPVVGAYGQGVRFGTADGGPVSGLVLEYTLEEGGLAC